ncbi:MAG: CPBP family intramembrane metalloprotease [Verrucomicrobia bacterium]|nr:CPBP family intramembrane metalloprotease [Verrucomicrobiota bacterium]
MKSLRVLGIYAVAVLAAALVLSFPAQWVCEQFGWFAGKPWGKFFRRCAMVAALAGLWPTVRVLGMAGWQRLGLASPPALAVGRTAVGWGLSFAVMTLLGWVAVWTGNRVWEGFAWSEAARPVAVGALVGVFEEFFFRGVVFGVLRKEWGVAQALWASSALYAVLHFWSAPPETLAEVVPALVSLTALGALLAWCYERTGSLFLSVGVHAGAVAALRILLAVTHGGTKELNWFFGSGAFTLVNGVAAWPLLALLWLALAGFERVVTRFYGRGNQAMGERRAGTVLPG